LYFIISLVILAIDLFTKYIIQKNMVPYQSIPVIDNIFHITYVQNTGAAFSILKGKTLFFHGCFHDSYCDNCIKFNKASYQIQGFRNCIGYDSRRSTREFD